MTVKELLNRIKEIQEKTGMRLDAEIDNSLHSVWNDNIALSYRKEMKENKIKEWLVLRGTDDS